MIAGQTKEAEKKVGLSEEVQQDLSQYIRRSEFAGNRKGIKSGLELIILGLALILVVSVATYSSPLNYAILRLDLLLLGVLIIIQIIGYVLVLIGAVLIYLRLRA